MTWPRMGLCGRSGRRNPPDGSGSGDRVCTGRLAGLLRAVLSLVRALFCWLWRRTGAAVTAAETRTGGGGSGGGSPERGERVRSHHRRAFEFIAAALKIDEDERGGFLHFCVAPNSIRESDILTEMKLNEHELRFLQT